MTPFTYRQWSGVAAMAVILGVAATKMAARVTQASLNELAPEASPGAKAVLNYNGQLVNVDVAYKRVGQDETIDLMLDGETLEHEAYLRTPRAFALQEADGDHFEPPLPLISIDGNVSWVGQLKSGGIGHAATATVTTTASSVKAKPVDMPATLATVTLQLDSGGEKKATRTLKFWMVKGRGVAASEFSMGVKRLPVD
ncbi:MAG: hypothetical protein ACYC96_00095 [Fimbriimonadaceae bacterium]